MNDPAIGMPDTFDSFLAQKAERKGAVRSLEIDIIHGDCREAMKGLPDNSVHLIVTDPPYFLDGLDNQWKKGDKAAVKGTGAVRSLPVGMAFDPAQGKALQGFIEDVARQWRRVLVSGGFVLCFSQPRLAHRMAIGIEDAGFDIRDQYAWHFTNRAQFKAFSMDHFIDRMNIPAKEKKKLKASMAGRKTPQLRPQFESIIMAQNPKDGTFVKNWQDWGTGLIDATKSLNGKVPSTVMAVDKPNEKERIDSDGHLTPKPVKLIEHLIQVFSKEGQTVMDCFLGSGTTAVAASRVKRNFIGIEINPDYVTMTKNRLGESK